MAEVWKDIKGQEGKYQISSFGRVRSLDRQIVASNGDIHNYKGLIMSPTAGRNHYASIKLRDLNGKRKTYKIHRLVAEHFIPNPFNKKTVNHKDADKLNNNVENLEWATYQENNIHARNTVKFKNLPNSKLVLDIATGIYYASMSAAARALNFNNSSLSRWMKSKQNKTSLRYV